MVTFSFNRDQLIRLETALDMLVAAKQGDGFNSDAAMEKSLLRAFSAALDAPCFPHPAVMGGVLAQAAAERNCAALRPEDNLQASPITDWRVPVSEAREQMDLDAGGALTDARYYGESESPREYDWRAADPV